jgi:PAS domain-containing protein
MVISTTSTNACLNTLARLSKRLLVAVDGASTSDDIAFKVQSWLSNLEAMTSQDAYCRFQRADGAYRWFNVRGEPLRDVAVHVQILIDIDDQKKQR